MFCLVNTFPNRKVKSGVRVVAEMELVVAEMELVMLIRRIRQ